MPEAFDKYVFCEEDKKCAEVLEIRCRRDLPNRNVTIITGNANASVENILAEMPGLKEPKKFWDFVFSIHFNCRPCIFKQ